MDNWRETRAWLFDTKDTEIKVISHRGKFSSSVIENTSLAFLTAVGEGADMVEMDLRRTSDGVLVGYHDGTMRRLFHREEAIESHTWKELCNLPLYNYVGEVNGTGLERFEQILESLKDRTVLTLDKCWDCWDDVYACLCTAQMTEQAIFKFYIEDENARRWAASHADCLFLPMVRKPEYLPMVEELARKTPVPAAEITPHSPKDPIYADSVVEWLKERRIRILCNSLNLGTRLIYGAGYDDLRSLRLGGREGWGLLVDKGVDMLQTDWPVEVCRYLGSIGRKRIMWNRIPL